MFTVTTFEGPSYAQGSTMTSPAAASAALEEPVRPAETTVGLGGRRLRVLSAGSGPALVHLHGLPHAGQPAASLASARLGSDG